MIERRINAAVFVLFASFLVGAPWIIPLIANDFWVNILAEILIWSLFAASVNLLFGYLGLLSFGQALFFGTGMYGVAIGVGQIGLGFWAAFLFGIALSAVMSLVAGILAVRLTWHYFAIITVVFSLIFYFFALTAKPLTGGDDGLVFSVPAMFSWGETEVSLIDPTIQYFFILVTVALCFLFKFQLLRSPLGRAFMAVRENDVRASLIGLNVYLVRLTGFICAGILAGVAGALFAFYGRYASAAYMFYHVSGEGVVWTIVGGAGTLFGPVAGTTVLILLREELSSFWEHYLLVVGAIVILVVIFAPRGLAGLWNAALSTIGDRVRSRPQESRPALVQREQGQEAGS
jgi:branched-chain amino acid transport system permease protein